MRFALRRAYYVPLAIVLVFMSVVVTLLFSSYSTALTEPKALALMIAGVTPVIAFCAYVLNSEVAFRSATIEAQKMLLEINKQYVANPKLLYLEGDDVGPVDPTDTNFNAQLKAMAYLKLNVCEVIFAVLPGGDERETWVRYFRSSLTRSDVLAGELEKYRDIYHPSLITAFDAWKNNPH